VPQENVISLKINANIGAKHIFEKLGVRIKVKKCKFLPVLWGLDPDPCGLCGPLIPRSGSMRAKSKRIHMDPDQTHCKTGKGHDYFFYTKG
jgi:hypothetical protein